MAALLEVLLVGFQVKPQLVVNKILPKVPAQYPKESFVNTISLILLVIEEVCTFQVKPPS
jgi:hypothetical protein